MPGIFVEISRHNAPKIVAQCSADCFKFGQTRRISYSRVEMHIIPPSMQINIVANLDLTGASGVIEAIGP
jgi:hypothetical protein